MAQIQDQFIAAGAQIIWVVEHTTTPYDPGTAQFCHDFLTGPPFNITVGWCVGDGETMGQTVPADDTWYLSPLAEDGVTRRGFDLIVSRRDMVIREAHSHGTGGMNENLTGDELLARVQAVIAGL
ncbi:MAG: hypothetical protein AB7S26_01790 [Sandaracinaceae bacterium]